MTSLPKTMRAIVQTGPSKSSLETVPVPSLQHGAVLVKVLSTLCHPSAKAIYDDNVPFFSVPYPIIPGSHAIGRVAAQGPDTTSLDEGQLVLVNHWVRARDDPNVVNLWGGMEGISPQSKRLYSSTARNGTLAEYVLAPLENTYALNEARLLGDASSGGLGYKIPDLLHVCMTTIAAGGLRSIDLKAGERVIVTPATGIFSGSAVDLALAMGANVVAASRSTEGLAKLKAAHPERLETVQLTGDAQADSQALRAFGPVDCVFEASPHSATGSTNVTAAAMALRPYGRVALMGGRVDDTIPISWMTLLLNNLTVRGQFMFEREDQRFVIQVLEAGLLHLNAPGKQVVAEYGLESLAEAMDKALETSGVGNIVSIKP
jgi:NADPH:quinone reductase-like Zn-dependent oxidoreductase